MHVARGSRSRALLLLAAVPLIMGSLGQRSNFNERILAAHNRERHEMAVPPLDWDDQLAVGAARWAHHLSSTGRFEHSPDLTGGDSEGENIWGGPAGEHQPESMVGLWVAEKKNYKVGTFPDNSTSGRVEDVSHYTQLIWARTRRVGCAISAIGREEILVCRYSSAGNVLGERAT